MSCCRNFCLSKLNFTTFGTFCTCCETGCCTCRIFSIKNNAFIMYKCFKNFCLLVTAIVFTFAFCRTCNFTFCRCNCCPAEFIVCFVCYAIVIKVIVMACFKNNFCICLSFTGCNNTVFNILTCICYLTIFCTCSFFSYFACVVMFFLCNFNLFNLNFVTYRTSFAFCITYFFTSSCYCRKNFVLVMACCRNSFCFFVTAVVFTAAFCRAIFFTFLPARRAAVVAAV